MKFKNLEMLSKKEDFQQALPVIERIFPDLEKLLCLTDEDFSDMLIIEKKKYFLSNQYKYIYLGDYKRLDVAIDYNKDGTLDMLTIKSKQIIDSICSSNMFDYITISHSLKYVNFYLNNQPFLRIDYSIIDDKVAVSDYSLNSKLLN